MKGKKQFTKAAKEMEVQKKKTKKLTSVFSLKDL